MAFGQGAVQGQILDLTNRVEDASVKQEANNAAMAAQILDFTNKLEDVGLLVEELRSQLQSVRQLLVQIDDDVQANDVRAQLENISLVSQNAGAVAELYSQLTILSNGIPSVARSSLSATGSLSYNSSTGVISYTTPNSDGIVEGSTNLYFTNARARSAISVTGSLSYNSSTGVISYTTPNSDGITEGSTHLFFTNARAQAALSGTGAISYNSGTGVISLATQTGWTADTGTDNRGSNATYTSPGASATYDQTQMNNVMTALQNVSRAVKSIKADLITPHIFGP